MHNFKCRVNRELLVNKLNFPELYEKDGGVSANITLYIAIGIYRNRMYIRLKIEDQIDSSVCQNHQWCSNEIGREIHYLTNRYNGCNVMSVRMNVNVYNDMYWYIRKNRRIEVSVSGSYNIISYHIIIIIGEPSTETSH